MKLIHKIVKGLSIGVLSAVMVANSYAATSTLTLEQAISRAISSCDKKEVYGSYKDAYEEINQYNKDLFSVAYRTSVNSEKLNNFNMKHINDLLTYNATELYLEVVSLNKKIAADKTNISLKEKELSQVAVKREKGVATAIEYKNAETALASAKAALATDLKNLEIQKLNFKNLTKLDITAYELEDNFELEPVKIEGAITSYFDKALQEYWSIMEDNIAISKIGSIDLIGSPLGDYKKQEAALTEMEYNLTNSKKTINTALETYYNNLAILKENISTAETQLDLLNESLKINKIRYEKGLLNQLEYEKQLSDLQTTENSIFDLTKQYILIKMMVETPTILVMK